MNAVASLRASFRRSRFPVSWRSLRTSPGPMMKGTSSEDRYSGLYPATEPYESGMLRVSAKHEIYYELSGNANAPTVVFVHGGPGGCTQAEHRRFFDPNAYRIVLFDQRGCGKSRPFASTEENNTPNLVSDLDTLRTHISAEKWGLFGGSWGSTLALAYCQAHPETVSFVVLRGIFLGRKSEIEWLYERGGAAHLFPFDFEAYLEGLPEEKRDAPSLLHAYHSILTGPQCEARDTAVSAFCSWESALSYFPGRDVRRHDEVKRRTRPEATKNAVVVSRKGTPEKMNPALSVAVLESHYFVNGCFFGCDEELLMEERMGRIRHIPAAIVQGRWDMVCPVRSAYDLANAWPEASFACIPNAGHSAFEEGTRQRLVQLTDYFRSLSAAQ